MATRGQSRTLKHALNHAIQPNAGCAGEAYERERNRAASMQFNEHMATRGQSRTLKHALNYARTLSCRNCPHAAAMSRPRLARM